MIRFLAFASLLLCAVLAAGCGQSDKQASATDDETLHVGMVFDVGGRGDKSFNDLAYAAMERARREIGIEFELYEPTNPGDQETGLRLLASKPEIDLIVGVGFIFTDIITQVAKQYPDKKFACVDYTVTPGQPIPQNLVALKWREEEGAYLVGALAALTSKTGRIGFVGGMETPLIQRFEKGYRNGALAARPDVRVSVKYAGLTPQAFANPTKGKELALDMYSFDTDVIFHASGSTGLGVFEAARDQKKLAIGVDADQYDAAPGHVLTSMLKSVDAAVFDVIKAVRLKRFEGGKAIVAGVRHAGATTENGVDYVYDERNKALIPDDVRAKVEAFREQLLQGKIDPLKDAASGS